MTAINKFKPAATLCYMGDSKGTYRYDTLWCAAYTVSKFGTPCKPTVPSHKNLGLDEVVYRCNRNPNIKTLLRAETQSLKLFMAMVDLFECPAKRIENKNRNMWGVDDEVVEYTNLLYFFEDQEYPAPEPFDTHPLIYYTEDNESVKTLMTSMLYDVYYKVPAR